MTEVKAIPDTYPRVTPHLSVAGAADALEFYQGVLGANVRMRGWAGGPCEIEVGGSVIMLGDEALPGSDRSPRTLGGTPVSLFVYVRHRWTLATHVEDVSPEDLERRAAEAMAS